MKDKFHPGLKGNVLHEGDEGQITPEPKGNVLHEGDEGQIASDPERKCPS
nr:hypothetical protein [Neobacillus sp. Marseille-Q6967]